MHSLKRKRSSDSKEQIIEQWLQDTLQWKYPWDFAFNVGRSLPICTATGEKIDLPSCTMVAVTHHQLTSLFEKLNVDAHHQATLISRIDSCTQLYLYSLKIVAAPS